MKAAVFDASVAVKWVLPESHADQALALLRDVPMLHAPAHWMAEAANVLWASVAIRHELKEDELAERLAFLVGVPVAVTALPNLLADAVAMALALQVTVYDALYLALAEELDLPFVTADQKLFKRAVREKRFATRLRWIGDMPAGGVQAVNPSPARPSSHKAPPAGPSAIAPPAQRR